METAARASFTEQHWLMSNKTMTNHSNHSISPAEKWTEFLKQKGTIWQTCSRKRSVAEMCGYLGLKSSKKGTKHCRSLYHLAIKWRQTRFYFHCYVSMSNMVITENCLHWLKMIQFWVIFRVCIAVTQAPCRRWEWIQQCSLQLCSYFIANKLTLNFML